MLVLVKAILTCLKPARALLLIVAEYALSGHDLLTSQFTIVLIKLVNYHWITIVACATLKGFQDNRFGDTL